MSGLVTAIAPETARKHLASQVSSGSARDAAAARVIVEAAEGGDESAAAFAAEAQALIGIADVRRTRAARLRGCAAQAAISGFDRLAAIGSDAALVEELEADKVEAAVIGAVRESHSPGSFGYVSPEETRMLSRKGALEHMTSGQLEQAFSSVLGKLYASGDNFGADDEEEEVEDDSAKKLALAAEAFGGDLPFVFGVDVYGAFWDAFKPNQDRLRKRLAKRRRALSKMESRLEALEDEDKKGPEVLWLRTRIKLAERSISMMRRKLGELADAGDKMKSSEKKAKKFELAETQEIKESIDTGFDFEDDDLSDFLGDDEILAAADVFGLGPRRRRAMGRRMRGIRRHGGRHAGRRMHRMGRRMWPQHPFYVEYPVYTEYPNPYLDDLLLLEEEDLDLDADLDSTLEDEGISLGSANQVPVGRRVFIGFFDRRASKYGSASVEPAAYGAGFFEQMGTWFSNLWSGAKTQAVRRKTATQAAREARAPHQAEVIAARKAAGASVKAWASRKGEQRRAGQQARQESLRASRGGPAVSKVAVKQAQSRTVPGAGGYLYQQNSDGSIKILKAPLAEIHMEGQLLSSGPAWTAITREIGPVGSSSRQRAS